MPTKRSAFLISFFIFISSSINISYASDASSVSTKYGCTGESKSQSAPLLNIATFNIGKGNEPTKATAIANLFEKYDVDILGMQELYRYGDSYQYSVVNDVPVAFADKFPGIPFYYYFRRQPADHSLMIVSKFPIIDAGYTDIAGGRGILHSYIDTPFGKLRFFDTHLQRSNSEQCAGLNQSIDYINSIILENDPTILVGDFNLLKSEVFNNCGGKAANTFNQTCTGTPCAMDGIDFVFPSLKNGPSVEMVCAKPDYLMDSHEFYVSTVKFGSSSYYNTGIFDFNDDLTFNFLDITSLLNRIFK